MDIQLLKLEEKLEKSNESVRELYDILFFEDDEFEKVFGIQLNDKKGVNIHDEFIIECFCVAFGIDSQSDLKDTLKRGMYSEIEINSILRSFELNFIPAFKELIKPSNVKPSENKLEEAKIAEKADSNHISHLDVLSEIENPTPSISTTASFQNQSALEKQNSPSIRNLTPKSPAINPQSNPTLNSQSTSTPSLHSSDPSVAPYANPALHIASKLDAKLDTPSASIPKDIYVSKKTDPYHEPVDL